MVKDPWFFITESLQSKPVTKEHDQIVFNKTCPSSPDFLVSVRFGQLKAFLARVLHQLNIFKHHPSNARQVRYQRYATRLYILITIISLIVLVFYSSINTQTHRETVYIPTESQYNQLQQIYGDDLSCPCTSMSMPYSIFINIQVHYHQVCLSDFVSSAWLNYTEMYNMAPAMRFYTADYRLCAPGQFQSLTKICEQAKQTIDNALRVFLQSTFVSSEVIPQQLFESQVNEFIRDWKSTTVNRYLRTVELVAAVIRGNQLLSTANTVPVLDSVTRKTTFLVKVYNCVCGLSQSCYSNMTIFNGSTAADIVSVYTVPNFLFGCFPLDALFASTLECFYNRSCMIEIDKYMYLPLGESFNFSALDASRNPPNETIESIVNRLMVDSWSSNVSFISYYNSCTPQSCTFNHNSRNDLFSVITTVIGIFGGLSIGFKLLIWIVLRFIEKAIDGFSCHDVISFTKNLLISRDEPRMIRRFHFVLVVVTLSIIYSLSAFTPQSITIQIQNPSLLVYQDLAARFADSLQCSCSQISIQYRSFLTIEPRFHQVCSSAFVSNDWIDEQNVNSFFSYALFPSSFVYATSGQFQSLASLCQLSQETVNDSLTELLTSDFINSQLLSSSSFDQRLRVTVNQFQVTIPNVFLNALSAVRETLGANMIISSYAANWIIATPPVLNDGWTAHTVPVDYETCDCGLSSRCVQPYEDMLVGCYPLEALLQSTLQCYYNQQCIDSTNTFGALNISSLNSSHFNINATVESIVNQLMIEEYSTSLFYEKYFDQCAPSSCTYSYVEKSNIIEGMTLLITLYGGLVIICRTIAVIIVRLILRRTLKVNPVLN